MSSKSGITISLGLAVVLLALFTTNTATNSALAAPASQARHGLTGSYYTADDPTGLKFRGGVEFDEFKLPVPQKQPDAVRVDAQIAFGKDKGFVEQNGNQLVWWTPDDAVAVVWKGYIHLPKAGTYYLTTVSKVASAVYLNEARVALNGADGGYLPSDAFTYDPAELHYEVAVGSLEPSNPNYTYAVPITIDRPRDFPIQVRYTIGESASRLRGIDLLWVTPDAKRDASGKPIAGIVPSDALYVDAPGPIEKSIVHGANSTISSDFLYFPVTEEDKYVTLTIRLADENGRPVAGKHVRVSPLTSYYTLPYFTFVQPDRPTDENGNATFKVKSSVADDLTFFATDLDDLVDVAQVGYVSFQKGENFFLPDTFAPYYDGKVFLVEPLPLVVGKPVTIKVPLTNRTKSPAELTATFSAHEWNIGSPTWSEIGKVERIVLQPGETREVSITWAPDQPSTHLCFQIVITGQIKSASNVTSNVLASALLPVAEFGSTLAAHAPAADTTASATLTRNLGAVLKAAGNYVMDKLGNGGRVFCGEGCTVDPTKGRVDVGGGAALSYKGHEIGGADVNCGGGAEQSPDPHKMLEWDCNVKVKVGTYEKTIVSKTGVIPAPAMANEQDPDVSTSPDFQQLKRIDLP